MSARQLSTQEAADNGYFEAAAGGAASSGMAGGPWGAVAGASIGALGAYMSARENRKAQERQMAMELALKQRDQELQQLQNTQSNYSNAYQSIMGAANKSLTY